ncbi:hypothetical protein NicSoilB8_10470 [Arthrobacter sp. NicSoilB8]|nr:hypothetical protein NicSoilB8_10470 [Arthrobacter sp. NicSoilB8]
MLFGAAQDFLEGADPLDADAGQGVGYEPADATAGPLGEMLGYYFRFYESQFGRACSAMHDPLAAALAVGGVSAAVAPVVTVDVDTTSGPGRGQTICDLRGRYMDYPEQPGPRCRVVLELDRDFAPHLVEVLLSFSESSESPTARLASAVPSPA